MEKIDKLYALSCVCFGACLGAVARFTIYSWVSRILGETYWATVAVNVVGSFFIGMAFVVFSEVSSPRLQLVLVTGLLASFTTFSTLSLDALRLLSAGQTALAAAHIGGQIIFGVSFCYFGVKIGQNIMTS